MPLPTLRRLKTNNICIESIYCKLATNIKDVVKIIIIYFDMMGNMFILARKSKNDFLH